MTPSPTAALPGQPRSDAWKWWLTIVLFVASYIVFQRQEVRA